MVKDIWHLILWDTTTAVLWEILYPQKHKMLRKTQKIQLKNVEGSNKDKNKT